MKKSSFSFKLQLVLLILQFVTFILMAQTASHELFKVGVIALIFLALLQIPIGNIDPAYNAKNFFKALFKIVPIVIAVIGLSMYLAPYFLMREVVTVFLWVLILGTIAGFLLAIIKGTSPAKKGR